MVQAKITKPATSLTLEPHQVILRTLVTEKGMHKATRYNQYAFEVNKLATKEDVKNHAGNLFLEGTGSKR